MKILLSNNANLTASSLAKQILTTSLKFKFADMIVNCARILREFASKESDEKSYETYDQYIKTYSDVLEAEILSEELYQRVVMNYYKPQSKATNLEEQIDQYCNELVSLSESYDSPVVNYNMYLVWAIRFEMAQDFEAMLSVCSRAEMYIENNPHFYQEDKLATFNLKKMSAYLHLRDYKLGRSNAEKCLKTFPEGSSIWFTFMEYYLLLAIHTENYINALAVFNKAIGNNKFKKLDGLVREKWTVYEAYLNYIIEKQGAENPILLKQKRKSFRVNRFINQSILYPKEQRIFAVLMIILQILFLMERKNFGAIAERIERLKSYANRQLKKEEYYRSIQFIRLLQQLNKADYQVDNLSNTTKYYRNLQDQPFFYRGMIYELEIIPYEKLWEMMLGNFK